MNRNTLHLAAAILLGFWLAPAGAARPTLPLYDAHSLEQACTRALATTRRRAEAIARLPLERAGVDSVLLPWNTLSREGEDVLGPVSLLAYVHPDKTVRDAGEACVVKATEVQTELLQNEALYQRVRALRPQDAVDAKYRQDLINAFEDSGVTLPAKKRARAKAIMERITALDQEFDRNLREVKTTLSFSTKEQAGLSPAYLDKARKDKDGSLILGFDYPSFYPFMQQAEDAGARRRYYEGFLNRGGERNLDILDEITTLRKELAGLYGLRSYADYATRHRMVGDARTVLEFLEEVAGAVREAEQRDVAELQMLKRLHLGSGPDTRVEPWDKEFYLEKLRQLRFNIDQEQLRRYFPTEAALQWVLDVTGDLYGLRFVEDKVPVWHPDVVYYDVLDAASQDFIGGLYLDLYPREGKYGHAAAFGVRGSSTAEKRTPITALVTNFDRKGLTQSEVETLLHEFGHALHGILSHTRYVDQSGTEVELDFVEAPSQMYEEWARRPESLRRLRDTCAECPVLDDDLILRLDAARRLGNGLFYGRQLLYASYDMALAGPKPRPAMPVWEELERRTALGRAEGTAFPGTFSHIAGGYAAGYYGYMWSEALALDMLSAFGDNLMNPDVGRRFRRTVLSRGGEVRAQDMVQEFLGRPTNSKAFFRELRGEAAAGSR